MQDGESMKKKVKEKGAQWEVEHKWSPLYFWHRHIWLHWALNKYCRFNTSLAQLTIFVAKKKLYYLKSI